MGLKSISILALNIEEYDSGTGLVLRSLQDLCWKVKEMKLISQEGVFLANEIEKCLKHNDITILIGEYTDEVATSLLKVFCQNSRSSQLGEIPLYSRFLDAPHDTVLYIQGLIVIPNACNICKIFESIVAPFLVTNGSNSCKSTIALSEECGHIPNCIQQDLSKVFEFSRYEHVRKALENIEKCFEKHHPDNVFLSFNGGKDCTVLLHLSLAVLKRKYPQYSNKLICLYVENLNTFREINDFVSQCEAFYNLDIVKVTKTIKEALAAILKNKPGLKACLMGTRRTDPYSEHLVIFQMTDPDWPQVMRVSPLLDWHYSEIWDYLLTLKVPYCKLYDVGYTSLGNVNNTIPNPLLRCIEHNKETYLPAYKLLDASQERLGRVRQLNKTELPC